MSPSDPLSVVIVSYNTRELLRACLQALQAVPLSLEVIVVDNASQDSSAHMVAADFPHVILLAQTHNTWFCGGNNIGIRRATSAVVLLLNPDTVVSLDALPAMLTFIHAHPAYGGVTCQLRYPQGAIQRTGSRVPSFEYLLYANTPLGLMRRRRKHALDAHHWITEWQRDSDHDVDVMPGSCLMMRREDILLDDALLLYFPEDDLARRTLRPARYLAGVSIEHHEKSSTRSWQATAIYFRDLLVYTRKHHGMLRSLLLWGLSRPLLYGIWIKHRLFTA